ncbi:acetyltransferase [Bacillus sp. Soil531]|nr:acetyltransferase [Bacillus sp. Soil531]
MNKNFLNYEYFKNINLEDPFFDSLKKDYKEFENWFQKKQEEKAYYFENEKGIQAFLYLKVEEEKLLETEPTLPKKRRIKIGTLKINQHGTKLGERFIKKAIDHAVVNNIFELYVTVFPRHQPLIELLERYGFRIAAYKTTENGKENVMVKDLSSVTGSITADYPLVNTTNKSVYLLSIFPEYHTSLFPDSILNNETYDVVKDVAHTNSIHKIYISSAPNSANLKPGDTLVIYRTSDKKGHAEYRSVATSICVVDEIQAKRSFADYDDFSSYCKKYSVFSEKELNDIYKKNRFTVIKMTYNLAMKKKLIRKTLADDCGLDRRDRWTIIRINDEQFKKIIELGGAHENFIIHQTGVC